ncbi:MAG: MFS transporter [Pseudonocardiales bacterium]|nr:MFS transporter [Pseudonocardiales bacterium]MBV9029700.1 MFS transporter [Pseudonocardiales bacterium]
MLGTRGFGRLLASRFATQWGDGVFQAGLGGAVLFNPERQAAPMAVAAGLAVLLLPYSLVGPFAGALLDRWDRRRILVMANLMRVVPIVLVALAVGVGVAGAPLYLGALLVTGLSRFVVAGMSAGLPHVAPPGRLVRANALATTVGSAMTVLGGMCAIGLRALIGPGNTGSAWMTSTAVLGSLVAAAIATGFRRGQLGPSSLGPSSLGPNSLGPNSLGEPDCTTEPNRTTERATRAVASGLRDGLAAVGRVPSVAAGLVALVAHRLSFGIVTLVALLCYRNSFTSHGLLRAGLSGVCELLAVGAAGLLLAAVLTPLLVTRFGRRHTVRGALLTAGAAIITLGLPMLMSTMLAAAFVLSTAGQVVKLSLDATVQADVADDTRGRVFALYDTVFNTTYVLSVALTATIIPPTGRAPHLLLLSAALYLLAAPLQAPLPRHGDISG